MEKYFLSSQGHRWQNGSAPEGPEGHASYWEVVRVGIVFRKAACGGMEGRRET